MIIIEPLGGLANRMRFIASAVWLKEQLNEQLIVIWNENFDLSCPYNLLFMAQDSFVVTEKKESDIFIKSFNQYDDSDNFQVCIKNNFINESYYITFLEVTQLISFVKCKSLKKSNTNIYIYIRSCMEFGDNYNAMKKFLPIPDLKIKVDDVIKSFSDNTIGVHIRRTDHHWSIENSPVEKFVEKMWSAIKVNSKTNFFLCTDDALVELQLKKEFGDKVISREKERSRLTIKGMQDAVVDLYSLSNTCKIWGSYWSSFSETSAQINDLELFTITKE